MKLLKKTATTFFILLPLFIIPLNAQNPTDTVSFDIRTHKYHCPTCKYVKKDAGHCVMVTTGVAKKKGGKACRECGGKCK
jgi:hypothetical protein